MTEHVSLDARTLEAALAVLRREQAADLPTARQTTLYRWFNVSAFSLAGVSVFWFIAAGMAGEISDSMGDEPFEIFALLLNGAAGLLSLSTTVLFFLNGGLIRKLYRLAKLRARLRLAGYFEPAFSATRKATRVGNAVTAAIIMLGLLMMGAGAGGIVAASLMLDSRSFITLTKPQFLLVVAVSLAVIAAGLGLVSLHFMRRGKQRLETVLALQETLARQASAPAQAEVKLSSDEYAAIARIERGQIIRDRADSILSARAEAGALDYLCQTSRQMNEAKSKLAPDLLAKVEGTITGLLNNPAAASMGEDSPGGSRTIPVSGTSLKIHFDVDPDRHVVRLRGLEA